MLEKAPVATADLYADIGFIRFEFEIGYAPFQAPELGVEHANYFAPSIGVLYGNKNMVYFLIGGQPWGGLLDTGEKRKILTDCWHLKFEAGVDFRISDLFYFNVSSVYLVPRQYADYVQHFNNLAFLGGLGVNF